MERHAGCLRRADGYLDNRVNALPILLEHGLTATFFITTGFLDRRYGAWWDEIAWMAAAAGRATAGSEQLVERCKRTPAAAREAFLDDLAATLRTGRRPTDSADADWMTWDHVRELRGAGMTVGAHTVSHPLLGGIEAAEQRREIATSVGRVGAELGEPPALFALPDGREGSYDEHTLAALRASGVRRAFLNAGGVAGPRHAEPLLQPRFNVWRGISARHWRALLLAPRPVLRR